MLLLLLALDSIFDVDITYSCFQHNRWKVPDGKSLVVNFPGKRLTSRSDNSGDCMNLA